MPYVHRYKTTFNGSPVKHESFESVIYDFFNKGDDNIPATLNKITEFLRVYASVTLTETQKNNFMEEFDFDRVE